MPSGTSSWMVHILGLERLFASRGPLTLENSSILDRALLEVYRPIMVLGAFFTGTPSLMSKPGWGPTTLHQDSIARPDLFSVSNAESDLHCLLWVLAQLPILFMERDKCLRQVETDDSLLQFEADLWTEIAQLMQSLQAWRCGWASEHENQEHTVITTSKADGGGKIPWETGFEFENVSIASAFVMYHAVLILLASVPLSLLKAGLCPPSQSFNNVGGISFDESQLLTAIQTSAISVCRSLGQTLQSLQSSQHQRDVYVFFPIHVVRRIFIHTARTSELEWLDEISEAMLSRTSLRMWATVEISDEFVGFHRGLF